MGNSGESVSYSPGEQQITSAADENLVSQRVSNANLKTGTAERQMQTWSLYFVFSVNDYWKAEISVYKWHMDMIENYIIFV